MKKLMLNVCAVVMTVLGLGSLATMSPAYATTPADKYLGETGEGSVVPSGTKRTGLEGLIKNIINVVLGLVGVIAVVIMIIGGINFITSQGDANKVTKARNTILYGVVGLVVALLAFAIVNFVLTNI